jgi:hypothetical protein
LDVIDQIESHRFIYLIEINEPSDNVLRLVISEAQERKTSEDLKMGDVVLSSVLSDVNELVADESCNAYEILFQDYVAYGVRDESFVTPDESEKWTGRLFQVYSRSHFLDYVRVATFASDDYPGKLGHYGINCLNHIVDIVSASQPIISLIRGAQQIVGPERGRPPS